MTGPKTLRECVEKALTWCERERDRARRAGVYRISQPTREAGYADALDDVADLLRGALEKPDVVQQPRPPLRVEVTEDHSTFEGLEVKIDDELVCTCPSTLDPNPDCPVGQRRGLHDTTARARRSDPIGGA